ncbi:hypothetical protein D3C75_1071310 [compost metagenome]
MKEGNGIVDGAVARPMLEIFDPDIIDIPPVAEYPDGNGGGHIGQVPIGPVILYVGVVVVLAVFVADEETLRHRLVKHAQQHGLHLGQVKAGVVPH